MVREYIEKFDAIHEGGAAYLERESAAGISMGRKVALHPACLCR